MTRFGRLAAVAFALFAWSASAEAQQVDHWGRPVQPIPQDPNRPPDYGRAPYYRSPDYGTRLYYGIGSPYYGNGSPYSGVPLSRATTWFAPSNAGPFGHVR